MVEGAQLLYVGAAYAVAGLVLLGLVVRAVLDHRAQRAALDAIEAGGGGWRERSDAAGPAGAPGR